MKLPQINLKVAESWIRHLKGNAATALLVPAFLEAIHRFTPKGFSYGVNMPTLVLVLLAGAVATITVGFQVLASKRPEFKPEIALVEKKALDTLNVIAESQLAPPPAPETVLQGVPTT